MVTRLGSDSLLYGRDELPEQGNPRVGRHGPNLEGKRSKGIRAIGYTKTPRGCFHMCDVAGIHKGAERGPVMALSHQGVEIESAWCGCCFDVGVRVGVRHGDDDVGALVTCSCGRGRGFDNCVLYVPAADWLGCVKVVCLEGVWIWRGASWHC